MKLTIQLSLAGLMEKTGPEKPPGESSRVSFEEQERSSGSGSGGTSRD